MIKAENAKKLAEDFLEKKRLELIEKTDEYIEGAITRCIKAEAERGLSAITMFPTDTLDEKHFETVLKENGYTCEIKNNGSIRISW